MTSRTASASYRSQARSSRESRRGERVHTSRPAEDFASAVQAWLRSLIAHPVVLALLVAFALVLSLYTPVRACYVAWRVGYDLHVQMDAEILENQELNAEVERLMTNEGVEDAARARGYVSADETGTVVVVGMPDENANTAADALIEEDMPWYVAPLDLIFHYEQS